MIRSVRAYRFNPNMQCCYLFYVLMRVTQNDKARLDLVDKVFGYNFPQPEPIWMKFGI